MRAGTVINVGIEPFSKLGLSKRDSTLSMISNRL